MELDLKDFDGQLRPKILDILRNSDLNKISSKAVRNILQSFYSTDLEKHKERIDSLVLDCLEELYSESSQSQSCDNEHELDKPKNRIDDASLRDSIEISSSLLDDDPRHYVEKPVEEVSQTDKDRLLALELQNQLGGRRTRSSGKRKAIRAVNKSSTKSGSSKRAGSSTFSRPVYLSDALEFVIGDRELPRHEVIKRLWKYIKDRDLQDPKDKRFILCDQALKDVFEKDRVSCFRMQKLLNKHIGSRHEIIGVEDDTN